VAAVGGCIEASAPPWTPDSFRRLTPQDSRRPAVGTQNFASLRPGRGSSFRSDPAKRAVLTLGNSPAWCVYVPAASTVVSAFMPMPTRDALVGRHLSASSQAHRRGTRASAKTGIGHNAKFCVLTTSRQGQASLPPHPDAHITRNSSHKHEFDIISVLGRPSGRDMYFRFKNFGSIS